VDDFFDFVVRNQGKLLGAFSVLMVVLAFWYFKFRRSQETPAESPSGAFGVAPQIAVPFPADNLVLGIQPTVPEMLKTVTKPVRPLVYSLIIGAIISAIIGWFEPIPPEAGLEWPGYFSEKKDAKVLVIFIHGFKGDHLATWKSFPSLLRDDDRFPALDIISVHYPTFIKRRNLKLPQLAKWIQFHLQEHHPRKYDKVIVVAHSMGGLVARELVILHQLQDSDRRINLIVSIATPHNGADIGAIASVLGVSTAYTETMAPGSEYLRELHDRWLAIRRERRPATFFFTCEQDRVVTTDSAKFQCDDGSFFLNWGHIDMVKPENAKDNRYADPAAIMLKHLRS